MLTIGLILLSIPSAWAVFILAAAFIASNDLRNENTIEVAL